LKGSAVIAVNAGLHGCPIKSGMTEWWWAADIVIPVNTGIHGCPVKAGMTG
jgi:Ni,Fe-hydrogenase III small subunit